MKTKQDIVNFIIEKNKLQKNENIYFTSSCAPVNYAIIKYWGKKSENLMIPVTESISISLKEKFGTFINITKAEKNELFINNFKMNKTSDDFMRAFEFISYFFQNTKFKIETKSYFPVAAGFASSASFFASLTNAILSFFFHAESMSNEDKSIIARIGSISAARSIYSNCFSKIILNEELTYAKKMEYKFKANLFLGVLNISSERKKISSRNAMMLTQKSNLYQNWPEKVKEDIINLENAIQLNNIQNILNIIESNSEYMHNMINKCNIIYDSSETLLYKNKIKKLRINDGYNICYTQDAGSNLKIISDNLTLLQSIIKNNKYIFQIT